MAPRTDLAGIDKTGIDLAGIGETGIGETGIDQAEIGEADVDGPVAAPVRQGPPPLAEQYARILAFERQWWRRPGAKEQAIRDTFGLSVTRYYQLLNRLLDDPAALAADPVLVNRLHRLRRRR